MRSDRYLALGPIEISFDELTVRAGGHSIPLTFMEFDTLAYLMRSAPRVVSQQELFSSVAGSVYHAQSSLMRVHVSNLRRKLGAHGQVIHTVRGRGFQFVE
jgi:two-component system response regulator CpxR